MTGLPDYGFFCSFFLFIYLFLFCFQLFFIFQQIMRELYEFCYIFKQKFFNALIY